MWGVCMVVVFDRSIGRDYEFPSSCRFRAEGDSFGNVSVFVSADGREQYMGHFEKSASLPFLDVPFVMDGLSRLNCDINRMQKDRDVVFVLLPSDIVRNMDYSLVVGQGHGDVSGRQVELGAALQNEGVR